jgi:hypothetical protein
VGLEVDFVCLQGDQVPDPIEFPRDLLITGAQKAIEIGQAGGLPDGSHRPTWIALHHLDFLPFRDRLRAIGVDYLVHKAVDRASLQLLFLHVLYRGPQKRQQDRQPVGGRVCCKIGPRWWPATLTELSADGCRILASHAPSLDMPITIHLLPDLGKGSLLELRGRVVRATRQAEPKQVEHVSVAVELEPPNEETMARLRTILEGKVIGSLVTHLQDPEPASAPEPPQKSPERRQEPRVSYPKRVPALVGDATRVLLGRDLSIHGMRVEPHPGLTVGSTLQVALHRTEREEPVIVDAEVVGDDGETGLRLRFLIKPDMEDELDELVSQLPSLEALARADQQDLFVVSKILTVD